MSDLCFVILFNLLCVLGLLFAVNVLIFIAKEYHNKLAMGMKGRIGGGGGGGG
jgi:hypothetical protein